MIALAMQPHAVPFHSTPPSGSDTLSRTHALFTEPVEIPLHVPNRPLPTHVSGWRPTHHHPQWGRLDAFPACPSESTAPPEPPSPTHPQRVPSHSASALCGESPGHAVPRFCWSRQERHPELVIHILGLSELSYQLALEMGCCGITNPEIWQPRCDTPPLQHSRSFRLRT